MILTLWILGCMGFSAIMLILGAFCGFLYFGRGSWREWLDRELRPRSIPYLTSVYKELVEEGVLTDEQVQKIAERLWTKAVQEAYRAEFEEAQRTMALTEGRSREQEDIANIRKALAL